MILKLGSVFSGIGAPELAAEWMGWENVFHCEKNEWCRTVLNYYWPKAISYEDIKQTDFRKHRGLIHILTGGFPCQPYSAAGKRRGKNDVRHLWPEMLRAVKEIQPRWVVGENVRGLINWNAGLVFHEVQADLEAAGYEVFPFLLPAAGVNAPHERYRIWFVGYAKHYGPHASEVRRNDKESSIQTGQNEIGKSSGADSIQPGPVTNTDDLNNIQGRGRQEFDDGGWSAEKSKQERSTIRDRFVSDGESRIITNTDNPGLQDWQQPGSAGSVGTGDEQQSSMFFRANWERFPTESPLCGRDDGLSARLVRTSVPAKKGGVRLLTDEQTFARHRIESIKAYGNTMVPELIVQIYQAIEQYELLHA